MDTIDNEDGSKSFNSNSTVSRYSCRILCERVPPYTAKIYAAAFDTKGRIQLSVSPGARNYALRPGESLFTCNYYNETSV